MNVAAFLYATTIIVGAISSGHGTRYIQTLNSQNLQSQKNDDFMYCLFLAFFQQTQNSLITNYFINIEKYVYNCFNCGEIYSYGMKKIFRINVDTVRFYRDKLYPQRKGSKITLDDYFLCYCGGNLDRCKFCNNQKVFRYTKICCSAKVLMIYFERNNHSFHGDVDIINQFNICNYYSISRISGLNYNPNYILKACISYCNTGKYFADCFVKNNNMNNRGYWYRFMDNQIKLLKNPLIDINEYEPQLLLYELDDFYFNNNLIFNPFTMSVNNNNMNIFINNIDNIMNNAQFMIYRNMMQFNRQNQSVENAQIQNQNIMKNCFNIPQNYAGDNLNQENNPIQNNIINFQLKFIIFPEVGDQSFEKNIKVLAQVRSNSTVKMAIDNFYKKALKEREAIKKFLLNGNELDPTSESTLDSLNIDDNTIIKAIKSDNFDSLNII